MVGNGGATGNDRPQRFEVADRARLPVLPFHYGGRELCLAPHLRRLEVAENEK